LRICGHDINHLLTSQGPFEKLQAILHKKNSIYSSKKVAIYKTTPSALPN
jgi:hypothetical protein